MKVILLSYNPLQIGQPALAAYLDTRYEIKNWYMPFAGAALLVVDTNAMTPSLAWMLRSGFPAAQFVLTPLDQLQAQGWMPQPFWDLLINPKPSGHIPASTPRLSDLLKQLGETAKDE